MWPGKAHGEMDAVFDSLATVSRSRLHHRPPQPDRLLESERRANPRVLGRRSRREALRRASRWLRRLREPLLLGQLPGHRNGGPGESVNHFGLRLKGSDGDVVTVDVTILNLGARTPGDFFLAHVLRTERIELPSLQNSDHPAPPPSPFASSRESPDIRARRLSSREVEVLGMLAAGRSTPEIAIALHISNLTARNHIQNILHKLEVHSKSEAVAFAFQKRLKLV